MAADAREDAPRPTVSVVVPVKDDGPQLRGCLAALRAQSLQPDEIIVVDNGCVDDSAEIAAAAGATVIGCREPGIPAASSRGYDAATGDLILRLDADCRPTPDWIREVVAAFARRPELAAVTGGARFIDGPRPLRAPVALLYLLAYAMATVPALGHLPLFGSNLGMRREAWQAVRSGVHRDDAEFHDDLDLAFHLGEHHRIGLLRGVPMGMSMRPFRSLRSFRRRMRRGFRTVTAHWPEDFPPRRWTRRARRVRVNPL